MLTPVGNMDGEISVPLPCLPNGLSAAVLNIDYCGLQRLMFIDFWRRISILPKGCRKKSCLRATKKTGINLAGATSLVSPNLVHEVVLWCASPFQKKRQSDLQNPVLQTILLKAGCVEGQLPTFTQTPPWRADSWDTNTVLFAFIFLCAKCD